MKRKEKRIFNNKVSYIFLSFHIGLCSLSELAIQFLLKDEFKLQPAEATKFLSVTLIPLILKPFLGVLSDFVPIFGYRRKYYILICCLTSITSWVVLSYFASTLFEIATLLFIINLSVAFTTVLGEAIMVELSKTKDEQDPESKAKDYVSNFFFMKDVGMIFSAYLKGYLVQIMPLRNVFLISATTPILILITFFLIDEKKVKLDYHDQSSLEENEDERRLITNPEVSRNMNTSLSLATMPDYRNSPLSYQFYNFILQKSVLTVLVFLVFFMATPAFDLPLMYFVVNKLNFTAHNLGQIKFISAICSTLAIVVFKLFFKSVKFRVMLFNSTLLYYLFYSTNYFLVSGLNRKIGIDDYPMALLSSSLTSFFDEFVMLPLFSLACILSPKHLEASVYSFFMGAINLGSAICYLTSAYLSVYYGLSSENFESFPALVVTATFLGLTPLIFLLLINENYFDIKEEDLRNIHNTISNENMQDLEKHENLKDEYKDVLK
jgi:hypothetical protein